MINKRLALVFVSILFAATFIVAPLNNAKALSGSDFMPGRIIDDTIFTNKNAMSVAQIQQFLNAKVPTCEIFHSAYNAQNPPPYTCLKDYQENTTTGANNFGQFTSGVPNSISGGKSAAQIIWDASQQYEINPQVLIVLLQKEQGLVTDTWPLLSQFTKATGYLCPDTAACNSNAGGFSKQVFGAAWQFRNDFNGIDTPGFFSVYGKGVNNIRLNPNAACGTKSVNIVNQATAVLYKYTPYTPNDAALNNLYGVGDGCSAYGNRNFWRYFTDWFGSTVDPFEHYAIKLSTSLVVSPSEIVQGQNFTATFAITNESNSPVTIGTPFVVVRGPQGQNRDIPGDGNITIAANSTYSYSKQWSLPDQGWHQFSVVLYKPGLGYSYTAPGGANPSVIRNLWINVKPNPRVVSSLSLSPAQPLVGQPYTASFSIRNDSNNPIDIGRPFVVVRGPQGQNRDIQIGSENVVIPANSTYNYSKQWITTEPGQHTFSIAIWRAGQPINATYPPLDSSAIVRELYVQVLP